MVPNELHHRAFWWLAEDVNFCVVSSTGPKFETPIHEDICTQLLKWTASTPAPPNAVYIIPHPQPPLKFRCQVCTREASCTNAYRIGWSDITCYICCFCFKISPRYWINTQGVSAKCRECSHSRFQGLTKFNARAEARRKERAAAEAWRGVPDIQFEVPEEETSVRGEDSEDEKMCPICHDNMVAPVQLECSKKHRFCLKCIYIWVYQTPPQPNCPMCRTPLTFE